MALTASFLWRFLDDVWDLLPTHDRELFQQYWLGQIRAGGNLQQKTMEANASLAVSSVPVFLTERWNKYSMNDGTADIFSNTEQIIFSGVVPSTLAFETAFFHTLSVSNSTRSILQSENIQFFDDLVRNLRYGKLVPRTIVVRIAEIEFTPNRDFIVNEITGEIQRTANSRMPTDQTVQISYRHEEYTLDLDYTTDPDAGTVVRTTASAIPSGLATTVTYSYNATPTIPLDGLNGAVLADLTTFEDKKANFGGVTAGRTLTILSGPNTGTYPINAVLTSSQLQIGGIFPSTQSGDIRYSINIFPHAIRVNKSIASIPTLQNLIDVPDTVFVEGVDYRVNEGVLASRKAFPLQTLGPADKRDLVMWAEVTKNNDETPYRNFGVLIDFFRSNSEEFKLALQGLWFTFWTGSTHGNLLTGLHILLGLPFAKSDGTVSDVTSSIIQVEDSRGQVIIYTIPAGLTSLVTRGQVVKRFDRLTNGVQIIDRNNESGFVKNRLGRPGIEKFLTSKASRGPGDTDETKALTLLENHLFVPQVLSDAITSSINVKEFTTFLDNMKPQWTEYLFSFTAEESEVLTVTEDAGNLNVDPNLRLTATVSGNEFNQVQGNGSHILTGSFGVVLDASSGGSQAAGNFRDLTRDFIAAGIGKGSLIRIDEGSFIGLHEVLERKSSNLLSIDIPDASLVLESNLGWAAVTVEQARLNHDSVMIRDPNIVLDGANYLTAGTLNTKTDANFASTMLSDANVRAMLLVDIGIAGAEVQGITAADIANGEIQVGTAPTAPVARAHKIGSVALTRVLNAGPVLTDAVVI